MGLFNRLGREVEQFRRTARAAADEGDELVCRSCGARVAPAYEECPRCGGEDLVTADDESAGGAEAGPADGASGAEDAEEADPEEGVTGVDDAGDGDAAERTD